MTPYRDPPEVEPLSPEPPPESWVVKNDTGNYAVSSLKTTPRQRQAPRFPPKAEAEKLALEWMSCGARPVRLVPKKAKPRRDWIGDGAPIVALAAAVTTLLLIALHHC